MTASRTCRESRRRWRAAVAGLLACLALEGAATGNGEGLPPEVRAFVADLVQRHGFDRVELEDTLARATVQGSVLRAVSTPGTARPWHEFRPRYVNAKRIGDGLRFWEDNAEVLGQARAEYGVPEEIVVAVIGVETMYGRQVGNHRVLDSLYTLAFEYPPREEFFRSELEQYLLFTRDSGFDPERPKGSYAGAMGIPQFMPSSVRRYAVDFDGDGQVDLWGGPADSIGSVANYLHTFGWQADQPVMMRADMTGEGYVALLEEGIKPSRRVSELVALGVTPAEEVPGDPAAALFRLEGTEGPEYWLGFENFYVITRYNRSLNYATAVYQLADEIKALRQVREASPAPAAPRRRVRHPARAKSRVVGR